MGWHAVGASTSVGGCLQDEKSFWLLSLCSLHFPQFISFPHFRDRTPQRMVPYLKSACLLYCSLYISFFITVWWAPYHVQFVHLLSILFFSLCLVCALLTSWFLYVGSVARLRHGQWHWLGWVKESNQLIDCCCCMFALLLSRLLFGSRVALLNTPCAASA